MNKQQRENEWRDYRSQYYSDFVVINGIDHENPPTVEEFLLILNKKFEDNTIRLRCFKKNIWEFSVYDDAQEVYIYKTAGVNLWDILWNAVKGEFK